MTSHRVSPSGRTVGRRLAELGLDAPGITASALRLLAAEQIENPNL